MDEEKEGKRGRVDLALLQEKLREGATRGECAKFFGVSEVAIHKALKKIDRAVTQAIVTRENPKAVQVVERALNEQMTALDLIDKATGHTLEIEDACMKWHKGEQQANTAMPSMETGKTDPRQLAIKAQDLMVRQAVAKHDILDKIYGQRAVRVWMEAFYECMAEESVEFQQKFRRRLQLKGLFPADSGGTA